MQYEKLRTTLEDKKREIDLLREKRNSNLRTNADLRALKKRMYAKMCPYCDKAFNNINFLEKHLIKRHAYDLKMAKEADIQNKIAQKKRELEEAEKRRDQEIKN